MKKKPIIIVSLIIILLIFLASILCGSIAIERGYIYRYIAKEEYVHKKDTIYLISSKNYDELNKLVTKISDAGMTEKSVISANGGSFSITDAYVKKCKNKKIIFMVCGRECAKEWITDKLVAPFNFIIKKQSREIGVLYCTDNEALFEYVKAQIKYHQINLLPLDNGFYVYEMVGFT